MQFLALILCPNTLFISKNEKKCHWTIFSLQLHIIQQKCEMEHLTKHFISSTGPILNLEQEDGLRKKADADLASKVNLIQNTRTLEKEFFSFNLGSLNTIFI